MTLHAATFSIYMLSTIITILFLGLGESEVLQSKYYHMADTFTAVCSSLTQAIICYIFWNIENLQEPFVLDEEERLDESIDLVRTQETAYCSDV
jgi:hypothetical protein